MGRDDGLRIVEIPGERWELALQLLRDGGPSFLIEGEVPVRPQRSVGWPGADGHIHVWVYTLTEPRLISEEMARRDARAGLAIVETAEAADPRLTELLRRLGAVYEYLYDYGMGAVKIADIGRDGSVSML